MDRRFFVKAGIAGVAAGVTRSVLGNEPVLSKAFPEEKPFVAYQPVIVSTWDQGMHANKAGWEVLMNGGSSLDAVEAGARYAEADVNNRSVGIGGFPDQDGHVTLDACIMDWESRCGAVAFLEGIVHPVSVARHIMEHTSHVMLVGAGARKYALKNKFDTIRTPLPEVKKAWKELKKQQSEVLSQPGINPKNHDTLGLLAMDAQGRISGACTTSGWVYKLHGRVGDSPIIGAGLFIDQEVGGAVATGLGESILRIAGSHTVVELMRQGRTPQEACKETIERLVRKHKDITGIQCSFLAMDTNGKVGAYAISGGFKYALRTRREELMIDADYNRTF